MTANHRSTKVAPCLIEEDKNRGPRCRVLRQSITSNRKDNLMKRYLFMFGSNLLALVLIGVMSLTALGGVRPFHLVEHGTLTATPRDRSGTVLDVIANGTGTATHLGAI